MREDEGVMGEPDYVVIRAGPDLPEGWMPADLDGRWYNRKDIPLFSRRAGDGVVAAAIPSGRFEVRDDGAVAEVWEVRPQYR